MNAFHWTLALVIIATVGFAILKLAGPLAGMSWLWLAAPSLVALVSVGLLMALIIYAASMSDR